jgi:hypothetical protein
METIFVFSVSKTMAFHEYVQEIFYKNLSLHPSSRKMLKKWARVTQNKGASLSPVAIPASFYPDGFARRVFPHWVVLSCIPLFCGISLL